MNESMIVEAAKSAGGSQFIATDPSVADAINRVPPAEAIERFQAAMAVAPIPFASEASAAWRQAQLNNQGILHRIRALSDLREMHSPSMGNLVELQYEVMNLAFQQEVVAKVADKASTAIQTLVKNQ